MCFNVHGVTFAWPALWEPPVFCSFSKGFLIEMSLSSSPFCAYLSSYYSHIIIQRRLTLMLRHIFSYSHVKLGSASVLSPPLCTVVFIRSFHTWTPGATCGATLPKQTGKYPASSPSLSFPLFWYLVNICNLGRSLTPPLHTVYTHLWCNGFFHSH